MLYQLSYAPKDSSIRFFKLHEGSLGMLIIGNEYPIPDSSLGGVHGSVNGNQNQISVATKYGQQHFGIQSRFSTETDNFDL